MILIGTVHFPNSVGKFLPFLVSTRVRLFYIRSKIFLQIRILWILLFQMIYYLFVIFHIFMVKLSVYEKELHPTELGGTSLILTVSKKMSLILTLLIKYIEKLNFRKKLFFHVFYERWRGGVWDIFVERIKLYHSLKVQDKYIYISQNADLEMKTLEGSGKKAVPNSDGQLFFFPNSDGPAKFCP